MSTESGRGRLPTLLGLIALLLVQVPCVVFWLVSLLLLLASYTPTDQPWVYAAMALYPVSLVVAQVYAWMRWHKGRYATALGLGALPLATAMIAFVSMAIIWPS